MRIVHTADWHVGRIWKSISRLDETSKVLDHLAEYLEREKVDLLLVAGDVFDTANPSADAEQLVFDFFRRLGAKNIPAVVIAGNHDSPGRIDAYASLADLAGVHLVGKPRNAAHGGVLTIPTAGGEAAIVAGLPFASPGVFASALDLPGDLTHSKTLYAEKFREAASSLAGAFRPECVNLLMAHTSLEGAVLGNSERQAHLGEEWTAAPQTLPKTAQYVALGHIHKPQRLQSAPVPTEYAGSPLQLDFGEAGQMKTFVVVEVHPGQPAQIEHVAYEGSKSLVDLNLTLEELQLRQAEFRTAGWLRVNVQANQPVPELVRKVRQFLPNAMAVRLDLPEVGLLERAKEAEATSNLPRGGKSPLAIYREYHQQHYQRPPDAEIEEAFQKLYAQCEE
jgi:DNA repair protein SbcD/Mre11